MWSQFLVIKILRTYTFLQFGSTRFFWGIRCCWLFIPSFHCQSSSSDSIVCLDEVVDKLTFSLKVDLQSCLQKTVCIHLKCPGINLFEWDSDFHLFFSTGCVAHDPSPPTPFSCLLDNISVFLRNHLWILKRQQIQSFSQISVHKAATAWNYLKV